MIMSVASAPASTPRVDATAASGSGAFAAFLQREPRRAHGRATPAGAFAAARRRYVAGERIDMRALAIQLGVSRPTLYRWTGGREQLLCDVLFSFYDESFVRAQRDCAHLTGSERLIAIFRQHVGELVTAAPLQTFLQQETHAALRILTSSESSVQIRAVDHLAALYRAEQAAGSFRPRADVDTLAFAVVRVTEAFIYNDVIVAVEPEVDRAAAIVALLLEGPVESRTA